MAYVKQTWVDNETLINADKLNHIEDGIGAAGDDIDAVKEMADSAFTAAKEAKESIPTKVSELDNDTGYITNDALDGYALEDQLPTKVSELENDVPYATGDELSDMGERMTNIENTAITAINVNGEAVPVSKNTADITIEAGGTMYYGVCKTDSAIAEKTVTIDGFELYDGVLVAIFFEYGNSVADIKLKINDNGAMYVDADMRIDNNEGGVILFAYKEEDRAYKADPALSIANKTRDSALTGITVNGEAVPVTNNTAGIEFDDVSNGSDGIRALTVDGDLFDYVNDVCDTIGTYFMRATSDTPNIPETAAFFIMLLRNSNTQATMIAFRAGSNTNTYMCKEQASAWGDWTKIIPAGGSEPTVDGETLVF